MQWERKEPAVISFLHTLVAKCFEGRIAKSRIVTCSGWHRSPERPKAQVLKGFASWENLDQEISLGFELHSKGCFSKLLGWNLTENDNSLWFKNTSLNLFDYSFSLLFHLCHLSFLSFQKCSKDRGKDF